MSDLLRTISSEVIRDSKNEELQRRLEIEAKLAASEEITDDLVDSVIR